VGIDVGVGALLEGSALPLRKHEGFPFRGGRNGEARLPKQPDSEGPKKGEQGLSNLARGYQGAAPYMAASTQLVASVALFSLLGWWLDGKLGHETPWMLLLGAGLGMTGGFISFFRTVLGKRKNGS
jgi:F0F1-type ATP synthase assembly protein I